MDKKKSTFLRGQGTRIKQLFLNRSLASKFTIIYIVIIIVCIICNITIVRFFYDREVRTAITALASQNLESISQKVDTSIRIISKSSTYLLGSSDVQNYLVSDYSSGNISRLSKNLRNTLYLSLESMPAATSIIIFGEDGNYEYAARYSLPNLVIETPKDAPWYEEVWRLKGSPIYTINGGGYFQAGGDSNYLSLIRLVNSTEDAKPIGYMMINIPLEALFDFNSSEDENYSDICVYSGENAVLPFTNKSLQEYFDNQFPANLSLHQEQDIVVRKEHYLLLNTQISPLGLQYFSATKFIALSNEYMPFLLICLFTGFITLGMLSIIALCTKWFITAPLQRLTAVMKKTETGDFHPANVTTHKDEIGGFQDSYNEMVNKIQDLLRLKIIEQKRLRKAELNILQEQIKPHFLYNSLNGIAYLINSNQNDTASDLIISLSEYYRESLSKGSDVIPLSVELNIVKNYMKLQIMRFQDIFNDEYEIQQDTLNYTIPRLVLQPLVENSLIHGIIPAGEPGTITIKCYKQSNELKLHIKDDGIGMDKEQLTAILNNDIEWKNSFGLRGTVERLQIFYEKKEIYTIVSSPGEGTEIIFSLPLRDTEV